MYIAINNAIPLHGHINRATREHTYVIETSTKQSNPLSPHIFQILNEYVWNFQLLFVFVY